MLQCREYVEVCDNMEPATEINIDASNVTIFQSYFEIHEYMRSNMFNKIEKQQIQERHVQQDRHVVSRGGQPSIYRVSELITPPKWQDVNNQFGKILTSTIFYLGSNSGHFC